MGFISLSPISFFSEIRTRGQCSENPISKVNRKWQKKSAEAISVHYRAVGAEIHPEMLNLSRPGGQIMPTSLLIHPPPPPECSDLPTALHYATLVDWREWKPRSLSHKKSICNLITFCNISGLFRSSMVANGCHFPIRGCLGFDQQSRGMHRSTSEKDEKCV